MNSSTRLFIVTVLVADLMAIVYFGGRFFLTGSILAHHHDEPHIVVEGVEEALAAANQPQKAKPKFDPLTYVPDLASGQKISGKCMACHTFDQGGKNKTGPNLFGIYGKKIAANANFSYSGVLADMQKTWTDEELNAFLEAPKKYAPGTKMQYNGVKKPEQRADLIAWLKTLK